MLLQDQALIRKKPQEISPWKGSVLKGRVAACSTVLSAGRRVPLCSVPVQGLGTRSRYCGKRSQNDGGNPEAWLKEPRQSRKTRPVAEAGLLINNWAFSRADSVSGCFEAIEGSAPALQP